MRKLILAVIAGAAIMGAAQAEGAYIGAAVSAVKQVGGGDAYKPSAKLFGGYDLDKNWGVEVGYINFGSSSSQFGSSTMPLTATMDGYATYLAGKAIMPINEQVSLVGKLGVGNVKSTLSNTGGVVGASSVSQSRTNPYGSVGLQYNLNKQVALTADVEHLGETRNFGVKSAAVSLGTRYSF
jgi:hypothetical protein